jgi:hypothetical protein
MATTVRTAGVAIVAAVAASTAFGGLLTGDDEPSSSPATASIVAPDTASGDGGDSAITTDTKDGSPTTLLPGARLHSELGWTMQIGSDWTSGESAEGVSWTFGDQAQVEVITRTAGGSLEDHAATLVDELDTSFADVTNARAEAVTLDDDTSGQRITARADVGGTPVGIVIYVVQGSEQFIGAAYVAEQSEFDATAEEVEAYLRTLRADA